MPVQHGREQLQGATLGHPGFGEIDPAREGFLQRVNVDVADLHRGERVSREQRRRLRRHLRVSWLAVEGKEFPQLHLDLQQTIDAKQVVALRLRFAQVGLVGQHIGQRLTQMLQPRGGRRFGEPFLAHQ